MPSEKPAKGKKLDLSESHLDMISRKKTGKLQAKGARMSEADKTNIGKAQRAIDERNASVMLEQLKKEDPERYKQVMKRRATGGKPKK